jgi:DNA-binding NarL/FixJ family response regulator
MRLSSHRQIQLQDLGEQTSEESSSQPHIGRRNNLRKLRRIRVVVAEDHPVMRDGLSQLITQQEDMEVIGQASDGVEAVRITRDIGPDVVLMDVTMPILDGIEATRQIVSGQPEICIIGLSMHEDPELAAEMMEAGAANYFTKTSATDELLDAIRACIAKS